MPWHRKLRTLISRADRLVVERDLHEIAAERVMGD
jgi:hypothetical protein